jgi:hypothetical protein
MQVKIGDHQHSLSIQQLPIVPYHSSTYHKAQGLSCDKLCLWQVPTAGDPLMLYVGLTRVRNLDGLYMREPLTIDAARCAKPPVELLREISRQLQPQPLELRPDPDVLARQIEIAATKAKRAVGEAAQPSSNRESRSRNRSEGDPRFSVSAPPFQCLSNLRLPGISMTRLNRAAYECEAEGGRSVQTRDRTLRTRVCAA